MINNNMSEKVVNSVTEVIKNNTGLKHVFLGNNSFHSATAIILQCLKEPTNL